MASQRPEPAGRRLFRTQLAAILDRVRRSILLALALCVASASASMASEIGEAPTLDFNRCDKFIAPCGEPTVVGKKRFFDGRYEWVLMTARDGICFFTEKSTRFAGSGSGGCGPHLRPSRGDSLNVGSMGPDRGRGSKGKKATHLGGPASLDVATVRVIVRKRGQRRTHDATLIRVVDEFAEELGVEPFAYWGQSLHGCADPRRVRVKALDSGGRTIDKARPHRVFGCH